MACVLLFAFLFKMLCTIYTVFQHGQCHFKGEQTVPLLKVLSATHLIFRIWEVVQPQYRSSPNV